jgi:hypothetical protein
MVDLLRIFFNNRLNLSYKSSGAGAFLVIFFECPQGLYSVLFCLQCKLPEQVDDFQ